MIHLIDHKITESIYSRVVIDRLYRATDRILIHSTTNKEFRIFDDEWKILREEFRLSKIELELIYRVINDHGLVERCKGYTDFMPFILKLQKGISSRKRSVSKEKKKVDQDAELVVLSNKYFENENLNNAYLAFLDYRREKDRKKLPSSSILLQVKKLKSVDPEYAIRMINQTIEHGWTGLHPLKESNAYVMDEKKGYGETLNDIFNE